RRGRGRPPPGWRRSRAPARRGRPPRPGGAAAPAAGRPRRGPPVRASTRAARRGRPPGWWARSWPPPAAPGAVAGDQLVGLLRPPLPRIVVGQLRRRRLAPAGQDRPDRQGRTPARAPTPE